jgi:hypothetical protein
MSIAGISKTSSSLQRGKRWNLALSGIVSISMDATSNTGPVDHCITRLVTRRCFTKSTEELGDLFFCQLPHDALQTFAIRHGRNKSYKPRNEFALFFIYNHFQLNRCKCMVTRMMCCRVPIPVSVHCPVSIPDDVDMKYTSMGPSLEEWRVASSGLILTGV